MAFGAGRAGGGVPSAAKAGLAASTLHRVVNLPSFSSSGRDFMVRFDLAVWPRGRCATGMHAAGNYYDLFSGGILCNFY